MRQITKIKLSLLLIVGVFFITTGFRCSFITPSAKELLQPIELTWWGTNESQADLEVLFNDYRVIHPNISITYRKLRPEEFENELINALAEDRGPDIFSIPNTAIPEYQSKIESLPKTTTLAYQVTQKSLGIKEETLIEVRTTDSITPAQLKERFIDVVFNDTVIDNQIYGLPLSVDTLVLFYNKDMLNNAGIPLPPVSWTNVQENVKKLTFQDQKGNLIQSGVALGESVNVEYSADLLSLLMIQNGAQMITGNDVTFGFIPQNSPNRLYNPGPEAIQFFTDFANSAKEVYTWNRLMPNSIDAFAQGKVAMIFGYQEDVAIIEAKRQGKLNYGIAKIPQIEGRQEMINFANYYVHTVSKKSDNINEAWDFIQFITKKDEARKYLASANKPTALRSLISEQLTTPGLEIFADQLLTAISWYHGKDIDATQKALEDMIDSISQGEILQEAINIAAQKIKQTL